MGTCVSWMKVLKILSVCTEVFDMVLSEGAYIDKSQEAEIKKFLGYKFKLSHKGWEAYRKQEYQILASNLFAARLSRYVSYIAVIIALCSLFIK